MNTDNWETLACERSNWRTAFTKGVMGFEDTQTQDAREKHAKRKAHLANPHRDQLPPRNQCPYCGRTCGSRITYRLIVKTVFVEDNLPWLQVIAKEEEKGHKSY